MVDAANARGMGVLGALNSTPGWATEYGAAAIISPPTSLDAYGDFAAAVASRHKGQVAAYEVSNEPNSATF